MKSWLAAKGTLIAVFDVYLDLYLYRSGVYHRHHWAPELGKHCVQCVGFDDRKQAWLCKNSWSHLWGDAGFFWIGYGECGIGTGEDYNNMWAIDGVRPPGEN